MEQTEQQYVTIKEFATLANVTTQAVYKRLNQTDSSLNKFVKYNGKMKLISKDALELFADAPVNQQGEGDGIYEDISLQAQTTLFSSYFDATLKVLSEQISSKDQQIKQLMDCNTDQHLKMQQQLEMKDKQLQEQLSAKDRQIADLQKLLDQQQQLHRAEQEQFRLIAADTTKEEKKGFFKRLFHKKDVETSEA
ncbi:MAG: DUF536 domain-containing protein [Oscillospiraceae bacterium]|nr:DUF536 domain-containing protein [Oscillospiraceae bacterium]MBR3025111.1 DUF536 domain-containing protein [Oscillospiraceae bacterium]MBR3536018.1 DUF536 domain-containing protein [Oscillospiraceae bacterium]MBR6835472.1 DUF536 domain-containing protein [Oscillospiraceae bacterium]